MQRNGTTIEQAIASLYARAEAAGLDVVVVAAEVVRSVLRKDTED